MNVYIDKYSPEWKIWFEDLANNLTSALHCIACNIEHVGSTSVEGLDAKPIIDIDIILVNFNDLALAKVALEDVGYTHKGNFGFDGRDMFETTTPIHPHHLYVCNPDSLAKEPPCI